MRSPPPDHICLTSACDDASPSSLSYGIFPAPDCAQDQLEEKISLADADADEISRLREEVKSQQWEIEVLSARMKDSKNDKEDM